MNSIRFRPLVQFLRWLNDKAPGDKKYRLDGVSAKTLARWFGDHDEPGPDAVDPSAQKLEDIGRRTARWFEGGENAALKAKLLAEVSRYDPDARTETWADEQDWARWFRSLWEKCQRPLDFLTREETTRDYVSSLLPPRLPVPGHTRFQIRLYLDEPAWCLLVWVDGHGQTQPIGLTGGQPWESFQFFHVTGEYVLGANHPDEWRLSDQMGAETIVLLVSVAKPDQLLRRAVQEAFDQNPLLSASAARLDSPAKTKGRATPSAPLQVTPLDRAVLSDWRKTARPVAGSAHQPTGERAFPTFGKSAPLGGIGAFHEHIRAQLTRYLERTVILSFANKGT